MEDDAAGPERAPETAGEDEGTPRSREQSRAFALALVGTLLSVFVPSLVWLAVLASRGDAAAPAEALLPFDLPGLEGGRVTQAAFEGRVVVVNVWASWCAPCREEAPVFRRLAGESSSGAAFYGIVSLDDPALARAFAREYGLDFPHAVDDGTFARAHRVTVLPTTLIFAADGSFAGRVEGPVSEARLRALIDDAVAAGRP